MNRSLARGPFQGVWQIIQFNWPFYIVALTTSAALMTCAFLSAIPPVLVTFAILVGCVTGWLVMVSLVVSHWIYDRSPLCRWEWLRDVLPEPRQIVNVHAGFDESSATLRELFPGSRLLVFDFYDPQKSTEPSVARARRAYPAGSQVENISSTHWPLQDASCDAVLLLLAAHELRQRQDRLGLFREARRVLTATGRVVLVEHLRDWPNVLAFGPGVLHFLARGEWLHIIEASRFKTAREFSITPFVRVFILEPAC
jgi:SAM-dependent methyltransferase